VRLSLTYCISHQKWAEGLKEQRLLDVLEAKRVCKLPLEFLKAIIADLHTAKIAKREFHRHD